MRVGLWMEPARGADVDEDPRTSNGGRMRGLLKEPRILGGIALLVVSALSGGMVMSKAAQRVTVWQTTHAVAAGTVVTTADVHIAEVAGDISAYAAAAEPVVGEVLRRDLGAAELVPQSALGGAAVSMMAIMIPLERFHAPVGLREGERVGVWVTTGDASTSARRTSQVLADVRIDRITEVDPAGRQGAVLAVKPADVRSLVTAIHAGEIDLVGIGESI